MDGRTPSSPVFPPVKKDSVDDDTPHNGIPATMSTFGHKSGQGSGVGAAGAGGGGSAAEAPRSILTFSTSSDAHSIAPAPTEAVPFAQHSRQSSSIGTSRAASVSTGLCSFGQHSWQSTGACSPSKGSTFSSYEWIRGGSGSLPLRPMTGRESNAKGQADGTGGASTDMGMDVDVTDIRRLQSRPAHDPATPSKPSSFVFPTMNSRDPSPSRAGSMVISQNVPPVAQSRPSDSAQTTGDARNTLTSSNAPALPSIKLCVSCDSCKPRDQWHKNQWKNNGRCIACVELEKERQARKREEAKKAARSKRGKRAKEKKTPKKRQGGKHAAANAQLEDQEERASATTGEDAREMHFPAVRARSRELVAAPTAVSDDQRHQASVSPQASRTKRSREDDDLTPSVFGASQTASPSDDATRVRQSLAHDGTHHYCCIASPTGQLWCNKGTKPCVESNMGESGFGGGSSGISGAFASGTSRDRTPASQIVKRSRECTEEQSKMVAARAKYEIKHHATLPAQDKSALVCSYGTPRHLGANTSAADGRGLSSTASDATRPKFHIQHHVTTAGDGYLALPSSEASSPPAGDPESQRFSRPFPQLASVDLVVRIQVVLDGSNLAFSHREDLSNPVWSPEGILLALKYFRDRKVPVLAFVPRPRVNHFNSSNHHKKAMLEAIKNGEISLVPTEANDDIFILSYAIQRKAHIVTNDQFRDHGRNAGTLAALGLNKTQLEAYLANYRVCFTFALDEFIPNPEAPLIRVGARGKYGRFTLTISVW